MAVHTIRLRAPWQREGDGRRDCWRRRFGSPTGLGRQDRVVVTIEGLAMAADVALNGRGLGSLSASEATAEFDVTGDLLPRNELVLWIDQVPGAEGSENQPPCAVSLRIQPADPQGST